MNKLVNNNNVIISYFHNWVFIVYISKLHLPNDICNSCHVLIHVTFHDSGVVTAPLTF